MKKMVLLLILILSLLATGCGNENQNSDQNDETEQAGEEKKLGEIEEYESENKDDEWSYKYSIEIDGEPITDEDIEINKRDFKIVFAENLNEELSGTRSLDSKEVLSGDRQDHLNIVDIEPTNTTWTDGTIVTALIYEFENVPKNTNFKLELTEELKEKLGLKDSTINIYVE